MGEWGKGDRLKGGQGKRDAHLALVKVPPPKVLAVNHTSRPLLLERLQTFDRRNPRHPIMSTGHNYGIEPLHPPIILLLSFLAQRHLPLIADLFHSLDRRVIRHQILIPVATHQSLNVPPYGLPVPERGVGTVEVDRKLALL